MNMNWGSWLQGLFSSLATAAITALTAYGTFKTTPSERELFTIAIVPGLITFFAYIKQCPPPIGGQSQTKEERK